MSTVEPEQWNKSSWPHKPHQQLFRPSAWTWRNSLSQSFLTSGSGLLDLCHFSQLLVKVTECRKFITYWNKTINLAKIFRIKFKILKLTLFVSVSLFLSLCMSWLISGSHRTICRISFTPLYRLLGIELRSSRFSSGTYTLLSHLTRPRFTFCFSSSS